MASFDKAINKWTKNTPGGAMFKKSPLYDEAYGDTKDMEEKSRKMQKKQREAIKRQSIIEQTRRAEADSEVSLRRARMQGRQYGRRSLLGA